MLTTKLADADREHRHAVRDRRLRSVAGRLSSSRYQSGPNDVVPPGSTSPIKPLLAAGDLNNDGGGELAFATGNCGASTCFTTVHILKGIAPRAT